MKAKEYFDKYEKRLMGADCADVIKAAAELMKEMLAETYNIIKKRHIKTDDGAISVIKEFNQKWNALDDLFEKKYGVSPIIRDGYKNYFIDRIPGLKIKLDMPN